jgi:hypothetical protein
MVRADIGVLRPRQQGHHRRHEPLRLRRTVLQMDNDLTVAVLGLGRAVAKEGVRARDPIATAREYVHLADEHDIFVALTPDNLTYISRFLAWSLPDGAGFHEKVEAVVGFGQARRQGIQLLTNRLHRLGVTRSTELVQMHLDPVPPNANVPRC